MFYSPEVIKHYLNPLNVGVIPADICTGQALVGSPNSGAVIQLHLVVKNDIIESIAYKVYGGGAMIAAMSWLSEKVKYLTVQEAAVIDSFEIVEALSLEPIKVVYALMAVQALRQALDKKN